jgi:hypothetical protein
LISQTKVFSFISQPQGLMLWFVFMYIFGDDLKIELPKDMEQIGDQTKLAK